MKELQKQIDHLLKNLGDKDAIIEEIRKENSLPPFSTENRLLAYLLSIGKLSYDDYSRIGEGFLERHKQNNQYISLFDMAPRTFGQTWGGAMTIS